MKNISFTLILCFLITTNIAVSGWVYEGQWGSYGTGDGQFNKPTGIAIASDGSAYVVDMSNNRIQYFTPTGTFIGKWGSQGSGDGQFIYPSGIAIAPNGYLYVADSYNHRVQYFT